MTTCPETDVASTVAINVALLLPDEVNAAAAALNARLSDEFRFDGSHLPHVTLAQQFIKREHLTQAEAALKDIVTSVGPLQITVRDVESAPFEGTHVWYWSIAPCAELTTLHQSVAAQFGPFASGGDTHSFFVDGAPSIRTSTIAYVEHFYRRSSGQNFSPHITVGFGDAQLRQAPFWFMVNRLAICQLGDLNTCRKILYERTF